MPGVKSTRLGDQNMPRVKSEIMSCVYGGYADGLLRGKAILEIAFQSGMLMNQDQWENAYDEAMRCIKEETAAAERMSNQYKTGTSSVPTP